MKKAIPVLVKSRSKICMRSIFFINRRAFMINLTCSGNHRLLGCLFWNFYRNFTHWSEVLLKMEILKVSTSLTDLIWKCPPPLGKGAVFILSFCYLCCSQVAGCQAMSIYLEPRRKMFLLANKLGKLAHKHLTSIIIIYFHTSRVYSRKVKIYRVSQKKASHF